MPEFRLPSLSEHVAVVGRNGTGKTFMGAWLLSVAPFDRIPFVIVDYKGDELLNALPNVKEISFKDKIKKPGVYIIHPGLDDDDRMIDFLWQVWQRGNTGLFFDEGYMVPGQLERQNPFNAILTQGRSKRIPSIILSQRPVRLSKFAFSESSHFCIFDLNSRTDQKIVGDYIPAYDGQPLPQFYSHWYDVKANALFTMQPVPDSAIIQQTFEDRLKPTRRFF